MIEFSENIYGRFLHHQCYESADLCNYLFAYNSVCCFVFAVVVEIKLNRNTNYKILCRI